MDDLIFIHLLTHYIRSNKLLLFVLIQHQPLQLKGAHDGYSCRRYCNYLQKQLSQTFAEKFTVTEELLDILKKTALSEMKKALVYCIILR